MSFFEAINPHGELADSQLADSQTRIFFADFSKGFDLIDHSILMQDLDKLQVHPALLSWISAFLFNRRQAVRIGSVLSQWQTLKGGIPQGTKLGVVLFMVMTNNLLANWRLRTKLNSWMKLQPSRLFLGILSASLILQSLIYMNLLMSIT